MVDIAKKKPADPINIANDLLDNLFNSSMPSLREAVLQSFFSTFELLDGIQLNEKQKQLFRNHYIYLWSFVNDYSVSANIQNRDICDAVLVHYHAILEDRFKAMEGYYEHYREQMVNYADEVRVPHDLGHPYQAGKAFAIACGFKGNKKVINLGVNIFLNAESSATKIIKGFNI